MCCESSRHVAARASTCGCGCCGAGTFARRFISPKEEREALEAYRDELKKELAGLEEHMRKLEKQ
jgi:hypothetical protein